MSLTQEGEALLRYCKGTEDLEGNVLSLILGGGRDRPVFFTMVGPTSVMTARIVDLCKQIYFDWPNLYLNFTISDSENRLKMVRSGLAALAIVPPEQVPNEMDSKKLKPDRYVLVASPRWKGRRLTDILENERVIDFHENDLTTVNYLKKFGLTSHLRKPHLYVNNNEAIVRLFSEGIGFGTLTLEIARPHFESGRLVALNGAAVMDDPLAATWYPRPIMPPYFQALLNALK
jgi:DNA-binding transcriptional LysR family regulator